MALNENALAGTLFRGFDHCGLMLLRDNHHPFRAAWVTFDAVAVLHVSKPVVKQCEYRWTDVRAQAVASAKILVNPNSDNSSFTPFENHY